MIRRVSGRSMSPALLPGDIVLTTQRSIKVGEVVLAKVNDREVIKRVTKLENNAAYLEGDNNSESTDSRHYGPVDKSAILGTVMVIFPTAIHPPKLVKSYGYWLGRVAAVLLALMALIHLFRIDTLVPILDALLPGSNILAGIVTCVIIFSEISAIPFVLRMKLSPLMHLFSGAQVAFAPLWWLLLTIWAYGSLGQVGQFGEFVPVYGSVLLILINVAWVSFNYYTIYSLGYNRLSVRSLLRK